jgi:sulfate permease, SulP family
MPEWLPKSVLALKDYNKTKFFSDALAGVTVGLVALPLAMAFAISSGVAPQNGIYCAIIAGFICSLLGGSTTQISGPTGAFVVVVAGIVAKYGLDGLFTCTLIAGVILIVMGITGLGAAVQYIPRPVVIGFTNGIAVLIASTQIKDFFGLKIDKVPGDFWGRMSAVIHNFHSVSIVGTTLGVISLALIILFMRYFKRVPGYIIALFVGTAITMLMKLPVETIGMRFAPGIPSGLPHIVVPDLKLKLVWPLISPALTVAMLGAIESLMSAVVSDRLSGDKHNPNTELFGQGVANVISPLFGGLPATGAIARTATNIRSGAKTPVSGMVHSLTLLVVLMWAAPLANHVPLVVLAAILLVVSYNMGEWREIPHILRLTKTDIWVWALTFFLTVFADLTVAVEFGMILAALLFIRRVATTTTVTPVTEQYIEFGRVHSLQDKTIPSFVRIFRIHGPFLFGATEKIDEIEHQLPGLPPVIIVRLRNMNALDGTGLMALERIAKVVQATGRAIIFCGALPQPKQLMQQSRFAEHIGEENVLPNISAALDRAEEVFPATEKELRRRTEELAVGTPAV